MTAAGPAPGATRVAVVTFDGFNELDSFIALGLLNRLRAQGFTAEITGPGLKLTSMNGVSVDVQTSRSVWPRLSSCRLTTKHLT